MPRTKAKAKPFRIEDVPMQDKEFEYVPGIKCRCWRGFFYFSGRMDNMIAAGIAKPDWFTDGKERFGRRRRIKRSKTVTVGGREIETMVRPPHYCDVRYYYTDAERAKYAALRQEREQERHAEEQRTATLPRAIDAPEFRLPLVQSTLFEVGALALYEGETVEIVRAYGPRLLLSDKGEFLDCDGAKVEVRPGYYVKWQGEDDDDEFIVLAGQLRLCDGSISHIKRVK